MLFSKPFIASLGLLSSVSASPSSWAVQNLGIRDDDERWVSENGGDVRISTGSHKINWGTTKPSDALEGIKKHCATNGCHSKDELEVVTYSPGEATLKEHTIKISVSGSFADPGQKGNKHDLVDMAKELVKASGTSRKEETSDRICTLVTVCAPQDYRTVELYQQTDRIIIRVQDDRGSQVADMAIHITMGSDEDGDWCDDITKIGGVLGGVIGSMGAGIFSLASLGCDG